MKIFNIFASMLALTMISNLSAASVPNDELGVLQPDINLGATAASVNSATSEINQSTAPTQYPSEDSGWPQNGASAKFWKSYWNGTKVASGLFNLGKNTAWLALRGGTEGGDGISTRALKLLAGTGEVIISPIAGFLFFSVGYCKSDENGDWKVTLIDNSDQQSAGSSTLQNLFGSLFGLLTLPATVLNNVK